MASARPPAPGDMLRLDNQLCFSLYSASLAMTRLYKPLLDALGLTYPQYLVMLVLWEDDAQIVSDIGARLSLDSGTLTPLLKRLEGLGLVERARAAEDERRVRISLTPAGRRLKARAASIPGCVFAATQCSLEEVIDLTGRIKDLRERISQPAA